MTRVILTILLTFAFIMSNSQTRIILYANGKKTSATLIENKSTEELLKILPVTLEMSPYGGFEVVGALPQSLPTSNSEISTQPGDIMLYQGNQLVIFYGSNSWSYTPIGKIDDATSESVKDFLGTGNVSVTLTTEEAKIKEIKIDETKGRRIFDLNGRPVNIDKIVPGIYIVDGMKAIVK